MFNKKDILSILLISLVSIGLISFFTISHINSIRTLNESANDIPKIEPNSFLDLSDKKTMDDIYLKIRHYQSIEREPIKHISNFYSEEEEKEEKKFRNLEASISLKMWV